jgi:hypothetical protein
MVPENDAHFMYFPLFVGSGYPKATAPSEAQKRPALYELVSGCFFD